MCSPSCCLVGHCCWVRHPLQRIPMCSHWPQPWHGFMLWLPKFAARGARITVASCIFSNGLCLVPLVNGMATTSPSWSRSCPTTLCTAAWLSSSETERSCQRRVWRAWRRWWWTTPRLRPSWRHLAPLWVSKQYFFILYLLGPLSSLLWATYM